MLENMDQVPQREGAEKRPKLKQRHCPKSGLGWNFIENGNRSTGAINHVQESEHVMSLIHFYNILWSI